MTDRLGNPGRRQFARMALAGGLALGAGRAFGAETTDALGETITDGPGRIKRRISGLQSRAWQDYFTTLKNDAILCDMNDRVLHYWGEDGFYRIYPTSVPLTDEMSRRGRTQIVMKRPAPEWRPTPNMIERNPDLPRYVGPGPENPLGVRAMNLSWQYYLIHGTNDIRKIGRQSSSGCIGLFNEHIVEIFDRAKVGTQVLLV
ncbi:L,D-transpeptidase [Rhodobacteraceae bacterium DSL-40]|uniref:L,D-transpeptidase n=1 Tax=Amaricoccus sp. B4 TaxID=3368557 RepID=UPI000DADB51D